MAATDAGREVMAVVEVRDAGEADPRDELTLKQRRAMRVLATGGTAAQAGQAAGVSEERVRRWDLSSRFRRAVELERARPKRGGALSDGLVGGKGKMEIPESQSARRSLAIDLLVTGVSITEAAEQSGYTRQHLSRLLNHDDPFRAEYRRRLAEAHEARANYFWSIFDHSASVINELLDEGDPRAAMEVFKLGARGVTDVERRSSSPEDHDAPLPARPSSAQLDAGVPELPAPPGFECEDCGTVARSRQGLSRHRNAQHGGGP